MAFTRKFLSALGIEAEKVDEIISAHAETVDALKEQRDSYKADAEKLKTVEKELADLKNSGGEDFKEKYDALKKDYNKFKADVEADKTTAKKSEAYKALLKDAGISEKRVAAILKVTDLSKVELDKEGKIKDAADLKKNIETEWADFVEKTSEKGAQTVNPPARVNGVKMTREEIYKKDENGRYVLSASERQKAIAENLTSKG